MCGGQCLLVLAHRMSQYRISLKFFVGENMNPDGMVALLDFREDGVTPYMIFFKDGLEIEKCVSAALNRVNVPKYVTGSSVSLLKAEG